MPVSQSTTPNILLRALSPQDYALLEPYFERSRLNVRDCLYTANEPIERVYFPEGGLGSIVSEQEEGDVVEIGLYGKDGFSGSPVVLGAGQSPNTSFIQVGDAPSLSLRSEHLLEACDRSRSLKTLLLRFAHTLAVQAGSTAAANAHFALPERLARWLLMCHDRVEGDQIELTHEFMSIMLAVRRSGVTVTLHTLEGTGAIRSTRGLVTILDRSRLEEIAGSSYGHAEAEYRRLIGSLDEG
jgi:CRP-like cAMP-binding protein